MCLLQYLETVLYMVRGLETILYEERSKELGILYTEEETLWSDPMTLSST